jgi:hypothetical protein
MIRTKPTTYGAALALLLLFTWQRALWMQPLSKWFSWALLLVGCPLVPELVSFVPPDLLGGKQHYSSVKSSELLPFLNGGVCGRASSQGHHVRLEFCCLLCEILPGTRNTLHARIGVLRRCCWSRLPQSELVTTTGRLHLCDHPEGLTKVD